MKHDLESEIFHRPKAIFPQTKADNDWTRSDICQLSSLVDLTRLDAVCEFEVRIHREKTHCLHWSCIYP
jgi:hypothetical protein